MSSSTIQVLQQAEALKTSVADAVTGSNEAWMKRQSLQDIYQNLLLMDLEYALDKKVEQDLWNHAFKNQINALQNQAKDKQNPKRGEIQASLELFLETASGFYIQLLQELCAAFKLDLPFRRKCSHFGIFKERSSNLKIKVPKKTSCMYICQHCLVHLGDIARYRQQIEQAQTYYRHAARLVPYNGQPYNQLAILDAAKGNKLSTVFYYIRSIAVRHPFPVASTNLEKFYVKICKETLDYKGKLSMSEIVSSFLQFHAFVHLCTDLDRAHRHIDRLVASLPSHFTSISFSSYQLIQMVAINLFAMHHARRKLTLEGEGDGKKGHVEKLSQDEEKCYEKVFILTVSLLDNLLHYTPKQEAKARDYHTLPALKIIMDWLLTESELFNKPVFKNAALWSNLSKLLTNIQSVPGTKEEIFQPEKYTSLPLPEDHDLQCFLPLQKCFSNLDFLRQPIDNMPHDLECKLRCYRLVEYGISICEKFPSLNLINYQKLNSGKIQFTVPTAQLRVLTAPDSPADRKSTRQNVAIQAIMQNKKVRSSSNESEIKQYTIQQKVTSKPDQDLMKTQVKRRDTPPNKIKPEKSVGKAVVEKNLNTDPKEFPPLPKPKQPCIAGVQLSETVIDPVAEHTAMSPSAPAGHAMTSPTGQKSYTQVPGIVQIPFIQTGTASTETHSNNSGVNLRQVPPPRATDTSPLAGPRVSLHPSQMNMRPSYEQGMSVPPNIAQLFGQNPVMVPGVQLARFPANPTSKSPLTVGDEVISGAIGDHTPVGSPYSGLENMNKLPMEGNQPGSSPISGYNSRVILGNKRVSNTANEQIIPGPNFTQPPPEPPRQFQPAQQNMYAGLGHPPIPSKETNMGGIGIVPNDILHPLQDAVQMQQFLHQRSRETVPHPDRFDDPGVRHSHKNLPTRPQHPGPLPGFTNPPPMHPASQDQQGYVRSPMMGAGLGISRMSDNSMASHQQSADLIKYRQGRNVDPRYMDSLNSDIMSGSSNKEPSVLTNFQSSKNLSTSFSHFSQNIPKPDSPSSQISSSSFFSSSNDGGESGTSQPVNSSTYSLFSQSPWSVQITKSDSNKSLSSSPFASQSNSLRTSPDPFMNESPAQSSMRSPTGMSLRYGQSDSRWGQQASTIEDTKTGGDSVVAHHMQSLWSSGPSPLERLLEQQKHQRQTDPH